MVNNFTKVYSAIKRYGLLLESDKFLPSVVGIVTGEKLSSSWWSHKKGQEIFNVLDKLADKDDILLTKLISGKVTFIHKSMWLDFLTVATSGEPWQFDTLSEEAHTLFKRIKKKGLIQTEILPKDFFISPGKMGAVVRDLEKKILVCSYQVHTDQGHHAKVIESWDHWITMKKLLLRKKVSVQASKNRFEHLINDWYKTLGGKGKLPWK